LFYHVRLSTLPGVARPRILVTGFGPFAGLRQNPSGLVAREVGRQGLAGARVVSRVLPVRFDGAEARVVALCRRLRPDAVLSLGVAIGAPVIRVETTALNRADFRVADAVGVVAKTTPSPTGAAARVATYDARAVLRALRKAGVPAVMSHHAGTHLCNLTLYHFLSALSADHAVGFLHLPLLPEQVVDLLRGQTRRGRHARASLASAELPSMSFDVQVRAVRAALEVVARGVRRHRLGTRR
jgi:pyroglutamyl-peptidase